MTPSTALDLLLLRLSLGLMYLAHAGLKFFVFTLPGTVQFFAGAVKRSGRFTWGSA
jgi:putative oxidoreductase